LNQSPTASSAPDPVWESSRWLPTTRDELDARGWEEVDVILVSGDAYVDHPAFGTAVVGRLSERLPADGKPSPVSPSLSA